MKRTPLRRVSKKRAKEMRTYSAMRKTFLAAHPVCVVAEALWGSKRRTTDIHHRAGRYNGNYLNEATWLAVSREAHQWIHDHPKEARERGWLV